MENKQGGTAGRVVRPCRECFRADIDSGKTETFRKECLFSFEQGKSHSEAHFLQQFGQGAELLTFPTKRKKINKRKEAGKMKITLKDGSSKEYQQPMSVYEIAQDISEGLARVATAGEVDGEVVDLRTVVDHDCELNILTFNDEKGKGAFRHTASHIMAQAIKRLYPETQLAIGPSIADGFYYDVDRETPFTAEDLEKIEAEMKKIVKENLEIKQYDMPRNEALAYFREKNEPYKVELIEDLPEDETISFYSQGEFTDLCAGPHLMTTKPVKAFKLTSLAGAYGRGD